MDSPRSALAVDVTYQAARALLVERADGRARVIAVGESMSTATGPEADAAIGARAAVGQVEAAAGRPLYQLGGPIAPRQPDGSGTDVIAVTFDARLSVAVVSLGDRPAVASALRALAQIDAEVGEPIMIEATSDRAALEAQLTRNTTARGPLSSHSPHSSTADAIVLVGPADAPALAKLAQALGALVPSRDEAPALLWAGRAADAEIARIALSERFGLRVIAPVRPSPEVEDLAGLRDALVEVWRERFERTLPGAETVARWANGALPRRLAEERALLYLAAQRATPIWLVRREPGRATVLYAEPGARRCTSGAAPIDTDHRTMVLPASTGDATDLRQRDTAALRAAVASLPAELRPTACRRAGTIIAGGELSWLGADDLARTLIDALEPGGAVQLLVDESDGLAALGGLAEAAPDLAAGALADDLLRPLGAVVAPGWRARAGAAAFAVHAGTAGSWSVTAGETLRVPALEGESCELRVDRPNWWDPRRFLGRRTRLRAEGGPLGFVLDARPHPAPGPVSLGRDPLTDDAAAPRRLADVARARPIAAGPVLIRRTRPVASDGRILVGPGDVVGADELVAQARGSSDEHQVVHAGRVLRVADPRPYLVKQAGGRVRAGETLAERRQLFGLVTHKVVAPVDGVLSTEVGGFGKLAIVPDQAGDAIAAHLPGTVVAILPGHGVTIETAGALITGAVGFGPERRGPLTDAPAPRSSGSQSAARALRGAVVALDVLDRRTYTALCDAGAGGAIVGSIEPSLAASLRDDGAALAIVATEGIGDAPLCPDARAALAVASGSLVCLSPNGQGSPRQRPEAVLPATNVRAKSLPELVLRPGARVRVIDGGATTGRVAAVLDAPHRFGPGVITRAAEVELDSGNRVTVPVPNLELIA